jgi:lipid-A-disaccharide synthase-like uncharacterized protein
MRTETIWLGIGFFGQVLFFMRFLVQWIASEIKKQSVIPMAFWYFSFAGGLTLLAYAIYRRDPVFIIGQSTGSIIYIRNMQLIYRERRISAKTENNTQ